MPILYIAGPIDLAGADGQSWKQILFKALEKHKPAEAHGLLRRRHEDEDTQWTSFDPAAPYGLFNDFSHQSKRCQFIEKINYQALLQSDIMVALVPSDKASVGTPIEIDIFTAAADSKDRRDASVYILSDMPYTKSVYLRNRCDERRYIQRMKGETIESWMGRAADIIAADYEQQPEMELKSSCKPGLRLRKVGPPKLSEDELNKILEEVRDELGDAKECADGGMSCPQCSPFTCQGHAEVFDAGNGTQVSVTADGKLSEERD